MTNKIRGVSRLNDTEKNSMDRRKDDMHESRNVVNFFLEQWYQPVATTGAIGPPGPSTCVGLPLSCACPASGCDCSSPRALRGPYCVEWVVFFVCCSLSLPDRNLETSMRFHSISRSYRHCRFHMQFLLTQHTFHNIHFLIF